MATGPRRRSAVTSVLHTCVDGHRLGGADKSCRARARNVDDGWSFARNDSVARAGQRMADYRLSDFSSRCCASRSVDSMDAHETTRATSGNQPIFPSSLSHGSFCLVRAAEPLWRPLRAKTIERRACLSRAKSCADELLQVEKREPHKRLRGPACAASCV